MTPLLPPLLMSVVVFLAGLKLVSSSGIGSKKGALGQKHGRAIRRRADARQATARLAKAA